MTIYDGERKGQSLSIIVVHWIVVPSAHAQVCRRLGGVTIENKSFWKMRILAIEIKLIIVLALRTIAAQSM